MEIVGQRSWLTRAAQVAERVAVAAAAVGFAGAVSAHNGKALAVAVDALPSAAAAVDGDAAWIGAVAALSEVRWWMWLLAFACGHDVCRL